MVNYAFPTLEHFTHCNNKSNRFILLLANAPIHPKVMEDLCENIKVMFLPLNSTSVIQPMDQSITVSMKVLIYERQCINSSTSSIAIQRGR